MRIKDNKIALLTSVVVASAITFSCGDSKKNDGNKDNKNNESSGPSADSLDGEGSLLSEALKLFNTIGSFDLAPALPTEESDEEAKRQAEEYAKFFLVNHINTTLSSMGSIYGYTFCLDTDAMDKELKYNNNEVLVNSVSNTKCTYYKDIKTLAYVRCLDEDFNGEFYGNVLNVAPAMVAGCKTGSVLTKVLTKSDEEDSTFGESELFASSVGTNGKACRFTHEDDMRVVLNDCSVTLAIKSDKESTSALNTKTVIKKGTKGPSVFSDDYMRKLPVSGEMIIENRGWTYTVLFGGAKPTYVARKGNLVVTGTISPLLR